MPTQPHDSPTLGVNWLRSPETSPAIGFAAVAAVLVLIATLLTPITTASAPNNGAPAGLLSLNMVELLEEDDEHDDDDGASGVMTLEDLRLDVLERNYTDGGSNGAGIDIALIDSGVAPVDGLDGDYVLHGPDLSFEAAHPEVAYLDTYGHGTHMAGIMVGRRDGARGLADGSRLVSLKVAGHDGVTTVPQVVAAIDWVVEHRDADGLNIRVLNLSLGQAGVSDHRGDILSAAVERAWEAGIFVVVSAGNRGASQGHLDSPAVNPYVLAVGAGDNRNGQDEEDQPPAPFTSHGDGVRNPDLMAPGVSIASYRVPGSTADRAAASARYGDDLFLGSGSSQSAAVASASAARLLAAFPSMTNDEVKHTLVRTTEHDLDFSARIVGEGMIDTEDAWQEPRFGATQSFDSAFGPGTGLVAPSGATWSGGGWSGATWSGATWSGATWSGATWSGATWSGATWSGATWSGATWSGATWSGNGWV